MLTMDRCTFIYQFEDCIVHIVYNSLVITELGVFTLTVITLERHYVITHAMHLNKVRQKLCHVFLNQLLLTHKSGVMASQLLFHWNLWI